ncbi:SUKH-4 family immunity protein [Streptomyces sp. SS8]
MVTFAQAQERAERWVNGGVPAYQHREVRVREFDLGFVAWAEDRPDGPSSGGGRQRLVIARDSGESTLWPALPVGEVIRRYEEEYGASEGPVAADPPRRVDLEATSFLLTPPEWLQEAADQLGIPGRREAAGPEGSDGPGGSSGGSVSPAVSPAPSSAPEPAPSSASVPTPPPAPVSGSGSDPGSGSPWDAADTSGSGGGVGSVRPPVTVFAPPISGSDDEEGGPDRAPGGSAEAKTALLPEGSALPRTTVAPAVDGSQGSPQGAAQVPGAGDEGRARDRQPQRPPAPATPPGGVHHAATMLADPSAGGPGAPGAPGTPPPAAPAGPGAPPPPPGAPQPPGAPGVPGDVATSRAPKRGGGPSVPPPPGEPGVPGARPGGAGAAAPGGPSGGAAYAPTQLVSADEVAAQGGAGTPAPGTPAAPGGGVHHAATMLAGPGGPGPAGPAGPGTPPPPGAPGVVPGAPSYGYPQQPSGVPMVGPGYMAVLRYRAPDGSEQQLIRRSAPGTPHPEWQILHELRAMNVPPQQVLELHTELECCDVPGGYCARMVRESWPQVRISHTAPYGRDVASRRQGVRHLIEHQGELHQVADGPARPAPVRVPLPPPHMLQPAPPAGPEGVAQELVQAFGPQAVFRFDQRAVSRQGVPDVVAQTLMWAGLPVEFGPFFWAQAQPGRPVPTLAELAQERGVAPAADAASYLVMGNDYGRQLCVQYGTAHIVAVPLEAPAGGGPAAAQFVNSGLPEFVRCMALLGRMWRLRYGLTPEQAGRWTVDFQGMLACLDPAALAGPENWWSVLLEQMWDGLL